MTMMSGGSGRRGLSTSGAAICLGIIKIIRELGAALNRLARPYLTVLVATIFNAVCAWAVVKGRMEVKEYIMAIGPTNAMIIGFWFGERSALKRPGQDAEGS